jgi:hypothetical protein
MLSEDEYQKRRALARAEIEHFARALEDEPIGVQIGLVTDALPQAGFQIFRQPEQKILTVSPFRLGENPNVRVGVAMITSAPEALTLHERAVNDMWASALKGSAASAYLRNMLAAVQSPVKAVGKIAS